MNISDRLATIANTVEIGSKVADIGTDHAYIPIFLIHHGIAQKVIAMDINKGPLLKANTNIAHYNMGHLIETRLSNGLEKLNQGEADTIIVSGMGGELINDILEKGSSIVQDTKRLILQPQSEIYKVREKLHQMNFKIIDEIMMKEDNKYYVILVSEKGNEKYAKAIYYYYGKILIHKKDRILKEYLEKNLKDYDKITKKLQKNLTENKQKRMDEIQEEVSRIKEVLNCL
ncbi:tRNA (adenine22-N1)-methyltransferase [Natranaerovirga hydrolytica]|uniref:tRNA (Adenine22-N1)-methyltransferase n=1 Tax=Natranaerovirga hydrolytica TaxID=680378 RepID=A0A4R1N191_9FIRM|nr:class I SAM-dependent methyltransferase [Natranaerovirga hydrolytica]TCK98710.1 tRNA (adenine22-N1)-methyltransferase [Natranaerovirga hydrolytica]